ncbi:MAG TPA: efflux RND transporter periplasmic adaptor subunit [Myxococcaceae bacterium]|nr:efflux RND transporter periplasmic adaptor subunit [Myxococcaceae bacterium]
MQSSTVVFRRRVGSLVLAVVLLGMGTVLAAWKHNRLAAERSAVQPEPVEAVTVATAAARTHRETTTAIGTVLALESITLRNELPGTVHHVSLTPGSIVEAGTVLVALDTSVETADLRALQAQAALAETTLRRHTILRQHEANAESELDQAKAQRDVAVAQVERLRAVIAKKIIRAPFRARVGLADVHVGQYLNEGVLLTTLQGVSDEVNVDFSVPQDVAAELTLGSAVEVASAEGVAPISAKIVAVDAKVDPTTRNAMVRARISGTKEVPSPGASVHVRVPLGTTSEAVAVPATALRKGPAGDHVWVVAADDGGTLRAHERMVSSGPLVGDSVLILKGLKPGEQVAASGSFKLREAVKVRPTPAATTAQRN